MVIGSAHESVLRRTALVWGGGCPKMILSQKHGYVFVELPRTGCTAVGKELLSQYDGERILSKHSTYGDFLRIASDDQERYFAFSSIRNPLDDAVSHYFKLKTDHHGRFSDPTRRRLRVGNRGADHYRHTGTNKRGERPTRRSLSASTSNSSRFSPAAR